MQSLESDKHWYEHILPPAGLQEDQHSCLLFQKQCSHIETYANNQKLGQSPRHLLLFQNLNHLYNIWICGRSPIFNWIPARRYKETWANIIKSLRKITVGDRAREYISKNVEMLPKPDLLYIEKDFQDWVPHNMDINSNAFVAAGRSSVFSVTWNSCCNNHQ